MKKTEEEVKQRMEETVQGTKRVSKEVGRDAKEAVCSIVNGKVQCTVKKGKHNIQRGVDKVEDAVD